MKTKIVTLNPKAVYHGQPLKPDGSETIDKTIISKPLRHGQMSADQKLKQMVQAEIAREKEAMESHLDYFDFEVPAEPNFLHSWVVVNPVSKKELINEIKSKKKSKQTVVLPDDRKPPAGKSDEKSANGKNVKSARENANEVADDDKETEQSED